MSVPGSFPSPSLERPLSTGRFQDAPRVFGLDLVRAIAIGLVLVSHCGAVFAGWYGAALPQGLAKCGTFGVDIFFVLSGYLVGRIVLLTPPSWRAWRGFMARRWLRTLPLYYLALAVLFSVWPPAFWQPDHARILLRAVPRYALFLQNFAWSVGDNNWFGASWSLTVEEWFYLGFSALLLGLTARAGRGVALLVTACLFLAGPALLRGLAAPANSAPHSVVTAVDQIGVGVVMAWFSLLAPARFARLAKCLPIGIGLCTLFWFEQRWIAAAPRQALWPDVLAAGIALCLPAAAVWRQAGGVFAGMARAVSLRAYGLYIVHLPVLELASFYRARWHAPVWCHVVAACLVILVLPVLSWRFVERPFMRLHKQGWGSSACPPSPQVIL